MADVSQDPKEPQPGSDTAGPTEYGSAVERISEVLRSADAAAEAIRAEALSKAEEIRRAAVEEGEKHLAQVKEEADRVREAEQRVDQMLAEAEARARATHEAADEAARREAAAREREQKLSAYIGPLETTIRSALEGFRGITAQLEELLEEPAREDETLVEALSESVRSTAGEAEEKQQETTNES